MADQDNGTKFVWFCAGAAIGAAIALLYAPASGAVTRRRIGKTAREGRDTIADKGREFVDMGRDLYDKSKRLADEAADLFEEGRKMVRG
jgi:gas vesicle protein